MNTDTPAESAKRKVSFVRVAIVLVVLTIVAVPVLGKKHDELIRTCNLAPGDPQDALAACDVLLNWTTYKPSTRSLMHRHKMRIYMAQQDWDAALNEVDLAIAEDSDSEVPWQWKSYVLAKTGDHEGALSAIDTALEHAPGSDYSMEMKGTLFREMGLSDEFQAYFTDVLVSYPNRLWVWKTWGNSLLEDKLYDQLIEVTSAALKRDPLIDNLLKYYHSACLGAGPKCPPLFPERRDGYPELSCSDAMEQFDFFDKKLKETGLKTVGELYAKETIWSKRNIIAVYTGQVFVLTDGDPREAAEHFIVVSKVFDCMFPEKYIYPLP
ncbi:tetratricopeptide repeat protein [Ruegeria sp.]|uniref:tetratricopeptide repeat protein n=1 Tax=Ruegeria sp. TaxID=1879320 RepID=UPI003B5C0AED